MTIRTQPFATRVIHVLQDLHLVGDAANRIRTIQTLGEARPASLLFDRHEQHAKRGMETAARQFHEAITSGLTKSQIPANVMRAVARGDFDTYGYFNAVADVMLRGGFAMTQRARSAPSVTPNELVPEVLLKSRRPGLRAIAHGDLRAGFELLVMDTSIVLPKASDELTDFAYLDDEKLADFPEVATVGGFYRPLMHAGLREHTPDVLYVGMLETNPLLRGRGVATGFYARLGAFAKRSEYRFLTGFHTDADIARFFLNRRFFLLEEVRPELREEFLLLVREESKPAAFYTIYFLHPEDVAKYIKPHRIGVGTDDRIRYKEAAIALDLLFLTMALALYRFRGMSGHSTLERTAREVLEDLNRSLPGPQQLDTVVAHQPGAILAHLQDHEDLLLDSDHRVDFNKARVPLDEDLKRS